MAERNEYKLEGTVRIPESKRKELNRHILTVLYMCGIRNIREIMLAGKPVEVVEFAGPGEEWIISLNYSIFEKRKREVCTYNMKTCELFTPDRGNDEFGIVMNLIMVLLKLYSETECSFTCGGKPVALKGYIYALRYLLGLVPGLVIREENSVENDPDQYFVLPFYRIILRENQDEFVEFWWKSPLRFSADLQARMNDWKLMFQTLKADEKEPEAITEESMLKLIRELYDLWECRLVDEDFIIEFMRHKDERDYRIAFKLLQEMMNEDTKYLPELTQQQANEWVIKRIRDRSDFTAMSAYISLLTNHKHRQEILGF